MLFHSVVSISQQIVLYAVVVVVLTSTQTPVITTVGAIGGDIVQQALDTDYNAAVSSELLSNTDAATTTNANNEEDEEQHRGALRGGRFGNGAVRKNNLSSMAVIAPPSETKKERESAMNLSKLSYYGMNAGGTTGTSSAESSTYNDDPIIHVMIDCYDDEDALSCKNRISRMVRSESRDGVIRFTHYLQLCHGWSAEIKDRGLLMTMDGVHVDQPRETMHIRDSIEVHGRDLRDTTTGSVPIHSRNLQSSGGGQYTPYGIDLVKAKEAWAQHNTKGENVRVCVMDTGVNRDHPDLDQLFGYDGNELVTPWWRDTDGHGTHITGTIAANDNSQGVVGVAPNAEIFTARVFSTNGMFYSSNIITALQVCKDGNAQVISMSLGGPDSVGYEQRAYQDLYEKFNIVTVAASGNTGNYDYLYPAAYDHVISVASVNWKGARSSFSTRNDKIDIAAPGESILSTWENGSYATVSGTSMACPHISGVVALMLSKNPSATPLQITQALTSSATGGGSSPDSETGYGLVDAVAAVQAISNYDDTNDDTSDTNNSNDEVVNVEEDDSSNNDNNSNTNTDKDCIDLVITVQTDRYGADTSHWLQSGTSYLFYKKDFDSFESYRETACVDPNVCTTYNIRDSFGDGISGEGIEIKVNGSVEYSGGNFGVGGIKTIGKC